MRDWLLSLLARLATEHPSRVLAAALVLALVSVGLALTSLRCTTNQDDLISTELAYKQDYEQFKTEFGDQEYLWVVIDTRASGEAQAEAFAHALYARLIELDDIREVVLSLDVPDTDALAARLEAQAPLLEALAAAHDPVDAIARVQALLRPIGLEGHAAGLDQRLVLATLQELLRPLATDPALPAIAPELTRPSDALPESQRGDDALLQRWRERDGGAVSDAGDGDDGFKIPSVIPFEDLPAETLDQRTRDAFAHLGGIPWARIPEQRRPEVEEHLRKLYRERETERQAEGVHSSGSTGVSPVSPPTQDSNAADSEPPNDRDTDERDGEHGTGTDGDAAAETPPHSNHRGHGLQGHATGAASLDLSTHFRRLLTEHPPLKPELLYSNNRKLLFLQILPEKNFEDLSVIKEPLARIRAAIDATRAEHPTVSVGLTGRPVLQADEMELTSADMTRASILAVLGVCVLFVLFFRGLLRPLLATLSLQIGIAWTFGAATLLVGQLNLLSIVFALVLVGCGIDFGIHVLARYQRELAAGRTPREAARITIMQAGRGNLSGGLTTACAFFATTFTDFKGLAELGCIAGTGILLCLIAMLLVFPAALVSIDTWRRRRGADLAHPPREITLAPERLILRHPGWLIGLAVCTAVGIPLLGGIEFDENLLALHADGLESVRAEKTIIEQSDTSTWFIVYLCEGEQDARDVIAQLEARPSVGAIDSFVQLADVHEGDAETKFGETLERLWKRADAARPVDINANDPTIAPESNGSTTQRAVQLRATVEQAIERVSQLTVGATHDAATETLALLRRLAFAVKSTAVAEGMADALAEAGPRYRGEMETGLAALRDPLDVTITAGDLPDYVRNRYIGKSGTIAVYAYPIENVWDPREMQRFLADVADIDHTVTGTPIQVTQSMQLMKEGFLRAATYSFCLVFLILVYDLVICERRDTRRFRTACALPLTAVAVVPLVDWHLAPIAIGVLAVLLIVGWRAYHRIALAVLPLMVGLVWLGMAMELVGVSINMANFFVVPILIGIAVDSGVHMMHRFAETGSARDVLRSVGTAVVLTSLTTMVGFGLIATSSHKGLASIGYVMLLGVSTTLLAALILLPASFTIWMRWRGHRPEDVADSNSGTEPGA